MIWDLPHPTHKRFLESMSPVPHLESVLTGRYIGFVQSLLNSKKPLLKLLFSSSIADLSSVTGQNVNFLLQRHSKPNFQALAQGKNLMKRMIISPLPKEELWKVQLIEEISLVKNDLIELKFDDKDLEDILEFVCTA